MEEQKFVLDGTEISVVFKVEAECRRETIVWSNNGEDCYLARGRERFWLPALPCAVGELCTRPREFSHRCEGRGDAPSKGSLSEQRGPRLPHKTHLAESCFPQLRLLFVCLFVICNVALREKCRSLMLELWSFLGEIARMLVHPSALPEVCLCAFRVNKRVAPRQVPSSQRQKCNRFTFRHLLTNNSNSFKWFNEPQLKRITENEEQNLCIQRCLT